MTPLHLFSFLILVGLLMPVGQRVPSRCPGTGFGGLSTRLLTLIMLLIINGIHFIL